MTLQEYYWLADHHYVEARKMDSSYVSNEERERIRELHAAKQRKG